MMRYLLLFLAVTVLGFSKNKAEDLRIFQLLPDVSQPPLVNPCIPQDFTLGVKEDDPFFTGGYYWGTKSNTTDYFADSSSLKGCLIRVQMSTKVTQLGFDRFSCDNNTHDLTAAGFTGVKMHRGKWGIFPYREIHAKGAKGRHYYQMWVGLNTEKGTTLCFQFIYPEYLNEPTQNQKNIWRDFVKKTTLLSMKDLLIARGVFPDMEKVSFSAFKRRCDQKFFIQMEGETAHFKVVRVAESPFKLSLPQVEIHSLITCAGHEASPEKVQIPYDTVDHFPFETKMLSPTSFQEGENYLLFIP